MKTTILAKRVGDAEQGVGYYIASQITNLDGSPLQDLQQDKISVDELEHASHEFVKAYRQIGQGHSVFGDDIALVASLVLTPEVQKSLADTTGGQCELPVVWIFGVQGLTDAAKQAIRDLPEASIGGQANRDDDA